MITLPWSLRLKIKLDRIVRKFRYTIYDGDPYSPHYHEPYLTRYRLGRLMIHVFYRQDHDDPHDHPWPFWTFPLHDYVEEVFFPLPRWNEGEAPCMVSRKRVVRAWRWHYREPGHVHRITGRYAGNGWHITRREIVENVHPRVFDREAEMVPYHYEKKTFITIVWRGKEEREWGFWKKRGLFWCWQKGKEYYNGGKHDLCG